jgi:hypothetical protein
VYRDLVGTYGIKTTISADAESLIYYGSGAYPKGNFSFIKNWKSYVALHAHTVDSTRVYSHVLGRGSSSGDTTFSTIQSRRVAHRYNPGNASVYLRYGIYDRIRLNDSLLVHNGYEPSPWMDFPNDGYISPNVNNTSPTAELTYDSLFTALHNAGKKYIRGFINLQDQNAWVGNGITNARWFTLPDQIYTTAAGLKIYCIGAVVVTGNPISIDDMRDDFQNQLTDLLGFRNAVIRGPGASLGYTRAINYGEIFGITQARNNGLNKCRIMYQHPKNYTDLPNATEYWGAPAGIRSNADLTLLKTGILYGLEALKFLAGGNPIHEWVYPWQTLDRGRGL